MGTGAAGMSVSEEQLLGRWGHSFEEDHDEIVVYRPGDYAFPRARGRDGIELRADGSLVDWAVGSGDAADPRPGTWRLAADDRILLRDAAGAERVITVRFLTVDRLEVQMGAREE